jgi:hypothetical protein
MTDAAHDWCAGLRVTRSRLLTVAELRRIQSSRRGNLVKASVWLLAIPVVLVACAAGLGISPAPHEPFVANALLILVILGIFLGAPLCIVMSNDYFKLVALLKRQYRDSEVLVCEGTVADLVAEPPELAHLRRQIGESAEVVLEVLKQSRLVWSVNGHPQESWVVVQRGRTAGAPDQARLAAQYVKPVETEDGTFRLHQRPLSEGECSELRAYLPQVKLAGGIIALVMNLVAVAHLVAHIRKPVGLPLMGIVMVTVAGWCDANLVLAMRARRKMLRDLRERYVVIYQPDPAPDASQASVVEYLPNAGTEWTTGGRAAAWRRLHGPNVEGMRR